jgi:hypothetical protein
LSGGFLIIIFKEGSIDRDLKSDSKSPKHLSSEDMKLKDICVLILRGQERWSLVVSTWRFFKLLPSYRGKQQRKQTVKA